MVQLEDFLQLAMDNSYIINIYDTEQNKEIIHQKEIDEIYDILDNDLFFRDVQSWDIDYLIKEFTINI